MDAIDITAIIICRYTLATGAPGAVGMGGYITEYKGEEGTGKRRGGAAKRTREDSKGDSKRARKNRKRESKSYAKGTEGETE
jgi:hypothetical protein